MLSTTINVHILFAKWKPEKQQQYQIKQVGTICDERMLCKLRFVFENQTFAIWEKKKEIANSPMYISYREFWW